MIDLETALTDAAGRPSRSGRRGRRSGPDAHVLGAFAPPGDAAWPMPVPRAADQLAHDDLATRRPAARAAARLGGGSSPSAPGRNRLPRSPPHGGRRRSAARRPAARRPPVTATVPAPPLRLDGAVAFLRDNVLCDGIYRGEPNPELARLPARRRSAGRAAGWPSFTGVSADGPVAVSPPVAATDASI